MVKAMGGGRDVLDRDEEGRSGNGLVRWERKGDNG